MCCALCTSTPKDERIRLLLTERSEPTNQRTMRLAEYLLSLKPILPSRGFRSRDLLRCRMQRPCVRRQRVPERVRRSSRPSTASSVHSGAVGPAGVSPSRRQARLQPRHSKQLEPAADCRIQRAPMRESPPPPDPWSALSDPPRRQSPNADENPPRSGAAARRPPDASEIREPLPTACSRPRLADARRSERKGPASIPTPPASGTA